MNDTKIDQVFETLSSEKPKAPDAIVERMVKTVRRLEEERERMKAASSADPEKGKEKVKDIQADVRKEMKGREL